MYVRMLCMYIYMYKVYMYTKLAIIQANKDIIGIQ